MHEYLFQPEVVRVALVVGVIVSILFYERVQLTTGGAIVPAYLAMFLPAPVFVVTTVVGGYLTYLLVSVVLAKRTILYGRRKFEVEMLVGLAFVAVGTGLAHLLGGDRPLYVGLTGIGFLIPGVIAHDMFRQGPRKTFLALTATTSIVGLFVFVFASLLEVSPVGGDLPPLPDLPQVTGYPLALILPAVVTSVLAGMLVFARLGLRSGGFITGAYLALFLAIGASFKRPVVWSLVLVILVERLLGAALAGVAQLSPGWLAQSVLVGLTGQASDLQREGIPAGWAAVGRLVVVAVIGLAIATHRLRSLRPASSAD